MNQLRAPIFILSLAMVMVVAACGDSSSDGGDAASNSTSNGTNTSNGNTSNGNTSNGDTTPNCDAPTNTSTESSPERIILDDSKVGTLCPGETHYYALNIDAGFKAVVRMEHEGREGSPDFLEYPEASVNDPIALAHPWPSEAKVLTYVAEVNGDYVFAITGPEGHSDPIPYTLRAGEACLIDGDCSNNLICDRRTLSCGTYKEPDCGVEEDDADWKDNGTPSQATELTLEPDPNLATRKEIEVTDRFTCGLDEDWFVFDVEEGDSLSISLSAELANTSHKTFAFVINSDGVMVAQGIGAFPTRGGGKTTAGAAHLPAGRYYAVIMSDATGIDPDGDRDEPEGTPEDDFKYTLSASIITGACAEDLQCAAPRPRCMGGVCVGIEGDGQREIGESCDDLSDCVPKADACFTDPANVNQWICTVNCTTDDACNSLEGGYCLRNYANGCQEEGICYPRVRIDFECPPGYAFFVDGEAVGDGLASEEDAGKCLECPPLGGFPCGVGECVDGFCVPDECQ